MKKRTEITFEDRHFRLLYDENDNLLAIKERRHGFFYQTFYDPKSYNKDHQREVRKPDSMLRRLLASIEKGE